MEDVHFVEGSGRLALVFDRSTARPIST